MGKYRKLIAAVIGALLIALNEFTGITVDFDAQQITNVVISLGTALGVWATPNDNA